MSDGAYGLKVMGLEVVLPVVVVVGATEEKIRACCMKCINGGSTSSYSLVSTELGAIQQHLPLYLPLFLFKEELLGVHCHSTGY